MKKKYLLLLICIVFAFNNAYSWGDKGHSLIARKAMAILPEEMAEFIKWEEYVGEHASDPDKRKRHDQSEEPKHYIDIDFYSEFRDGNMVFDKNKLAARYSDSIVTEMGLLPWATLETYKNLVQSFKDKNRDRILIYLTDLAHYVADGHQPLHTILNYDGQLTDQKGLHARYEIYMLEKYFNEISDAYYTQTPFYVNTPLEFIFHYITTANLVSEVIIHSDMEAFRQAGSRDNDEYYKILWFRTKYITVLQMNNASNALASLIYSAWTDAGKPGLNDLG